MKIGRKIVLLATAFVLVICSGFVFARPRLIRRVYVHVCDKYLAHIKIADGKITKLESVRETLDVLDPEIPGNREINSETVWIYVDSWDHEDFALVPVIATAIWRTYHQPPILAFNIDASCLYTETSKYSDCRFHGWEAGYRHMRDLAISLERNRCWPKLSEIPAEILEVVK